MTPQKGRRVYDHIVREGIRDVIELGTAYGVSASYMAAAVEETHGHVTTIDRADFPYAPSARDVVGRAGLEDHVTFVRSNHSSYNWYLANEIASRSDKHGNCEPAYDFCYIDGAHDFHIDGLAFFLIAKLLRPGGWVLFDDLDWTFANTSHTPPLALSAEEAATPHVRLIFDVLVKQHPEFSGFMIEDDEWAWAQKARADVRTLQLETTKSFRSVLVSASRRLARR